MVKQLTFHALLYSFIILLVACGKEDESVVAAAKEKIENSEFQPFDPEKFQNTVSEIAQSTLPVNDSNVDQVFGPGNNILQNLAGLAAVEDFTVAAQKLGAILSALPRANDPKLQAEFTKLVNYVNQEFAKVRAAPSHSSWQTFFSRMRARIMRHIRFAMWLRFKR